MTEKDLKNKKIAIVHDWLTGMRGGEKCLEAFCEIFPTATIFTLLHKKGSVSSTIENMDIRTSFLQRIPNIDKVYRNFLPLFPIAIKTFDLTGYDIVLSSSHCVAKGVNVPSRAKHICYCYTPMRYAWQFFNEYFANENIIKRTAISLVLKYLRTWDLKSNENVDHFIAISNHIKERIARHYKRTADVIYPPVDTTPKHVGPRFSDPYYLIVSALVPYKRIEIAVEAFNRSGKALMVVGDGPELKKLMSKSRRNILFYACQTDDKLASFYRGCEALIFPGEEDFGIVPVEAQVYGKPVIAYAKGGALETVIPMSSNKPTGIFFYNDTAESLNMAITSFEKVKYLFNPYEIQANTERFSKERFKREIIEYFKETVL